VENLLKAWIVLQDRQVPLIHDLNRLAVEAGVALQSSLLALETFAVRDRYSAAATELPEPRERLLERLEALRRELEREIEAAEGQER
jgi:HEPN domain-containing protein